MSQLNEYRKAILAAVEIIKMWHGPEAFDIYYRASPEMKPIRDVLLLRHDENGTCNMDLDKSFLIEHLKSLLAYASPAVDHCLAAEILGDHRDCKRCEIDRVLEAK